MNGKAKRVSLSVAKRAALIGVATGLIEAGKLALNAVPNVEVVTLLTALYGYIFGVYGIVSVYLFVGLEILIWGFSSYSMWIVSYLIYWPLLCLIFWGLAQTKIKNRFFFTAVAVAMTAFFGVLTSLIDCGILGGFHNNFWHRFSVYYLRGVPFYITQVICNLLLFIAAFTPLKDVLMKIYAKYVSDGKKIKNKSAWLEKTIAK